MRESEKLKRYSTHYIWRDESNMIMQAEWNHQGCQKKLGAIFLYKGVSLLYLSQKSFNYDTNNGNRPLPAVEKTTIPNSIIDQLGTVEAPEVAND